MLSSRLSQDRCGCWACRRGSWCLRAPSSLNGLARPPTSQLRKFRVCGMSDLLRTGRDSGAAPPRGLLTCRFNLCAPHADISVLDLLQWDQEWPLQTLRRYHTPGSASCYKRTKSGREVELFKRQAPPSWTLWSSIWTLWLWITDSLFLDTKFCSLRGHRLTSELFTWHWIFWGTECSGGAVGHCRLLSSVSLTFQKCILPQDYSCKWLAVSRWVAGSRLGPGIPSGWLEVTQAPSPALTCSVADQIGTVGIQPL